MWRLGLVGLAACGRIGFGAADTGDVRPADAARGDVTDATGPAADAAIAVVLVSDDFARTVGSGWGSADVGGTWEVFNPDSSTVSVGDGRGNVALASTSGYADFHVVSTTALDTDTRAAVSFDRLPATGSYTATVSARWVADGTDYRLHVDVLAGGALDLLIEASGGSGYTTLIEQTPAIAATADTPLELALYATGASPTALCGKLWLASAAEPSACTISIDDSTPVLQVPGISYLVSYDTGGAAPTASFGTFRFIRIGPL
jgi:hypothetical protein